LISVWEYTVWDAFLTMLWFFLFFIWIWLLISVFADVFRSDDLSGWGKAIWVIFVIVLPYIGVLAYLIARGKKMGENTMRDATRREQQQREYIQQVAGSSGGGAAAEIEKLAQLRSQGAITEEEYAQAKAKILA
jgi:hypothetical protein